MQRIKWGICETFFILEKRIYKNGLGNAHPALFSTFLYTTYCHSCHSAIFEYIF
jgi:hypothetical protein